MAVAPQAAREMQLWGWPQQMMAGQNQMPESWTGQAPGGRPVVVQPNSGNFQYIPNPRANKKGDNTPSKMQKLWMFNMGYEHHEQVSHSLSLSPHIFTFVHSYIILYISMYVHSHIILHDTMFSMGNEHHEQVSPSLSLSPPPATPSLPLAR